MEPNAQTGRWPRLLAPAVILLAGASLALAGPAPSPGARRVVAGGDHDYSPYEYLNAEGEPEGFHVDLLRAIGEATGLEVTFQLGPWEQCRRALTEGRIDVLPMFYSAERDRAFDFSEAHTILHHEFFVRRDSPPVHSLEDLRDREVIVQRDAYIHDYLRQRETGARLILVETEPGAMRLLASGKHDATVVTQIGGRLAIRRHRLTNLVSSGPPVFPARYCLAVAEGRTDLLADLNEGLAIVKATGRYREAYEKWLGSLDGQGLPLADVARYAAWVLVPAGLVAAAVLVWVWLLRRQVAQRTRDLQVELAERRRAEQALGESHALLRAVVEGVPDAVFLKDRDGRYVMINSAGARHLGLAAEEVVGKDDAELFEADAAQAIREHDRRVIASGQALVCEEVGTADGVTRHYLSSKYPWRDTEGKVIGLIGMARDIEGEKAAAAERARLEEQLRQASRLEAIGRLAGNVAHDFNNLLTPILCYADLSLEEAGHEGSIRSNLAEIRRAAGRARDLTWQLLAFGRRQPLETAPLNLNDVIRAAEGMLRRVIGEDIEVELTLEPALGSVLADPSQIEQVLLNLVVNARDAMPDGGTLTIETANDTLDEAYVENHPGASPGPHVMLAVTDTGRGMDAETRSRIFEPFFTTKPRGEGTGLGLASVYGIVKQHGGGIWVYSEPGLGTSFKVYFPLAQEAAEPIEAPSAMPAQTGGTETVLVVEDDTAVRHLVQNVLQQQGYEVLTAESGREAFRVAQEYDGPIELLLTDVIMPRMTGSQLYRKVRSLRPRTRVLYMCGYADNVIAQHGILDEGVHLLRKPFSVERLAGRVRETLDSEENEPPRSQ